MLKKHVKRLGAAALCAMLLLLPLLAAALPASASSVVLLEDTVLELEPYIPVSTFSLFPDDDLNLHPGVISGYDVYSTTLTVSPADSFLGAPLYVSLDGVIYTASVRALTDTVYFFGDMQFKEENGLPFYMYFYVDRPTVLYANFISDYSGSVLSLSADSPDSSGVFFGDLFTVGNSLLRLLADVCATIVSDPLLLMTTGVLFLGAVIGILGRMLSKS